MPTPEKDSTRTKPHSRGSIRHSLGLASMGKAIADAMQRESAGDKASRKSRDKEKDTGKHPDTRRVSAIHIGAARPSQAEKEKPPPAKLKKESPDQKTVTRTTRSTTRKLAAATPDDTGSASAGPQPIAPSQRSMTLRPRPSTASGNSALPKYRPRSMIIDASQAPPKKSTSPARTGTRRRLSSCTSDDDCVIVDSIAESRRSTPDNPPPRSISPLPRRAALKGNLSAVVNGSPKTPPRKVKDVVKAPVSGSPARPAKTAKTLGSASAIPRAPSVTPSSGTSPSPRTPKRTPTSVRTIFGSHGTPSSRKDSPSRAPSVASKGSPASRPKITKTASQTTSSSEPPSTPSGSFVEGASTDSAGDVEFMLGSNISPGAPTPALPRIRRLATLSKQLPETPSRSLLTVPNARQRQPLLSPITASTDSSPFLRVDLRNSGILERGSILSWDQLAREGQSLEGVDIETMLASIPAPFRSGAGSPVPSTPHPDIPESPNLSGLPSPGEYGSISQVILPDMTPSPALHAQREFYHHGRPAPMLGGGDSAAVTLLRLQLASVEQQAKDRLDRIQVLEEQLHVAKQARLEDADDLSQQMSELEEQFRCSTEKRERADDERAAYAAALEVQLQTTVAASEKAVQDALARGQQAGRASAMATLAKQQQRCEVACLAQEVSGHWASAREIADGELELVRAGQDTLRVLLAQLDAMRYISLA